jgi:hypothetical protein
MIDFALDNDEHGDSINPACAEERDMAKEVVHNHINKVEEKLKESFLASIEKAVHVIEEENFDKMADGKLLKAYTKLDSYEKKLALIQEYQH